MNGDGILDLVTANKNSGNVTILAGTGTGSFEVATGSPVAPTADAFGLAVGDFDGNGLMDLATTSLTGNMTIVHLSVCN